MFDTSPRQQHTATRIQDSHSLSFIKTIVRWHTPPVYEQVHRNALWITLRIAYSTHSSHTTHTGYIHRHHLIKQIQDWGSNPCPPIGKQQICNTDPNSARKASFGALRPAQRRPCKLLVAQSQLGFGSRSLQRSHAQRQAAGIRKVGYISNPLLSIFKVWFYIH